MLLCLLINLDEVKEADGANAEADARRSEESRNDLTMIAIILLVVVVVVVVRNILFHLSGSS